MQELRGGSILAKPNNFKDTAFLRAVALLCDQDKLKPSDKLFFELAFPLIKLEPCYEDTYNQIPFSYLFAFDVLDSMNGEKNPDTKTGKPINLSENSIHRRLAKYKAIGILRSVSHKIPIAKQRTSILELCIPSISTLDQSDDDLPDEQRNVSQTEMRLFHHAERIMAEQSTVADLVSISELKGIGSYQLIARYLSMCILADSSVDRKTTIVTFNVKGEGANNNGRLQIVTTCLDTSSLMVSNDILLVDILYQMIQQSLRDKFEKGLLSYPIKNCFRFDKVDILRVLGKRDSGEARRLLDIQLDRICSTSFEIEATEAQDLMRYFNFISPEGKTYDRTQFSLLSMAGEEFDEEEKQNDMFSEELKQQLAENGHISGKIGIHRKASRYISLKVPDFIESQINEWLQKPENQMMTMFGRDKTLLLQSKKGVAWALNNYLNTFLIGTNKIMRRMKLDEFIKNWYKFLDKDVEIYETQKTLFGLLTDKMNIIHYTNLEINSRKDVRFQILYSKLSDFLICVKNITPDKRQLRKIKYDIQIVRLNNSDAFTASDLNQKEPNADEIEWLESFFKTIS